MNTTSAPAQRGWWRCASYLPRRSTSWWRAGRSRWSTCPSPPRRDPRMRWTAQSVWSWCPWKKRKSFTNPAAAGRSVLHSFRVQTIVCIRQMLWGSVTPQRNRFTSSSNQMKSVIISDAVVLEPDHVSKWAVIGPSRWVIVSMAATLTNQDRACWKATPLSFKSRQHKICQMF